MVRVIRQVRPTTTVQKRTVVSSPAGEDSAASPRAYKEKKAIFRAYQVIWYILGVFETLLLFRFIFRLSGASPASPFVRMIYDFSGMLVAPFRGIYPQLGFERAALEWVTLVAMVVWAIIAYAIVYLFQLVKPVDESEVEEVDTY